MFFRLKNVPVLGTFVASAKHEHVQPIAPSKINPVAGTEIDPQLFDTIADRFTVTKVAQPESVQAGTDDTHSTGVLQRVQPLRKGSLSALTKKEKLRLHYSW